MKKEVRYLLNDKQINRYRVLSNVIEGNLKPCDAAKTLNLSERQVYRLIKGVNIEGVTSLIHKNSSKKPSHTFDDDFKQNILELRRSDNYKDSNFTHFRELLVEREGISISYNALYTLLTSNGFKSPKKRRKSKNHNRRKRKSRQGMLIQIDATPFEWFEGSVKYALHGAMDDATGQVVGLYMTKNECLHGYLEVIRQMVLTHGVPTCVYSDMHTIFRSPIAGKVSVEEQLKGKSINKTQFGRAMEELGVSLIYARSPQAKGKVERLWNTLQSRLPTDLKIAGVTSIEQANEFLADYIASFNSKFAVEPEEAISAYTPLPDYLNLDHILCVKFDRVTDNSSVFSVHSKHFMVVGSPELPEVPKKSKIHVIISTSAGIKVEYQGNVYDTINYIKPKKSNDSKGKSKSKYIPPDDHYFKYGSDKFKKLYFDESYEEVLAILQEIFLRKYA
ncbi:ISNCY family transposase [Gudongella sp. SC589]|uniref:ISNCY family transposase n=1 Tax=Gudongella sp. SC589 TaxID=3385990 RepID=UPI003904C6E7